MMLLGGRGTVARRADMVIGVGELFDVIRRAECSESDSQSQEMSVFVPFSLFLLTTGAYL